MKTDKTDRTVRIRWERIIILGMVLIVLCCVLSEGWGLEVAWSGHWFGLSGGKMYIIDKGKPRPYGRVLIVGPVEIRYSYTIGE
jgi:hypothetical protein